MICGKCYNLSCFCFSHMFRFSWFVLFNIKRCEMLHNAQPDYLPFMPPNYASHTNVSFHSFGYLASPRRSRIFAFKSSRSLTLSRSRRWPRNPFIEQFEAIATIQQVGIHPITCTSSASSGYLHGNPDFMNVCMFADAYVWILADILPTMLLNFEFELQHNACLRLLCLFASNVSLAFLFPIHTTSICICTRTCCCCKKLYNDKFNYFFFYFSAAIILQQSFYLLLMTQP